MNIQSCGTCGLIALTANTLVMVMRVVCVSITEFIIGIMYLYQCPIQPSMPIFNLVAGCIGILLLITAVCSAVSKATNSAEWDSCCEVAGVLLIPCGAVILNIIMFIFEVIISASLTSISTANGTQSHNSTLNTYCNPTLYSGSLAMTIIYYGANGIVLIVYIMFKLLS
ncbi:unnamed protein product [Rotaria socialis]|uniref:Uncharacterized protein n=1 Tax=Rotaria socialis TaxID=392032 RepID=A0A817PTA8_9BILA|nr:unnamed protein product [Rotaria socialis]CAF3475465.1 unnamed protein product [Rotaria socialis]CAF3485711.1 unnamed protein product [Rotaria socialis]CAF3516379.1 unnamed protein product [Rotaria socialis]CAF4311967.1 unnamed protein product [Rotaria socialis]